jgi:hypothetical protein
VAVEKCVIAPFLDKKLRLDGLHRGARFLEYYGVAALGWRFRSIGGA